MKKNHALILWGVAGAIVVWLLWRNRAKVAPVVFNTPSPNYLDIAYPSISFEKPLTPITASCGCNPNASNLLANTANSIKETEGQIEAQLKDYVDSINSYFQTETVS